MAKTLLREITERFFAKNKRKAGEALGYKESQYNHLINGTRTLKEFGVVDLLYRYRRKYNKSGLSDTQILDLLEADYSRVKINKLMSKFFGEKT